LSDEYIDRRLRGGLTSALAHSPVVAVTGPRTSGKSTLVRSLADTLIDLDDPAVRALGADDPTAFVAGLPEPVVIDEYQRVPELLASIKAELNRDRRPGRYVLAGSARTDVVPELSDFLIGRVELLTLWPFAMAELAPGAPPIIDRLFDGSILRQRRAHAATRREIVEIVLRGGYPIAVELPAHARSRWFANLATLVVSRISDDVAPLRHTGVAARFLRVSAARTAQVLNLAELGRDVGLGRDQAGVYLRLLELAYLTIQLPAWSSNLTSRQTKRPKLHLVDSGLAAHLQGLTAERLRGIDPGAATQFGSLLETFVVTEVMKQCGWASDLVELFHFRTHSGTEVDLVLESADGRVCAIEVKAGSKVDPKDLNGLRQLRDRLGSRFVAGVLLYTGTQAQQIDDRLAVAPIDSLWSAQ